MLHNQPNKTKEAQLGSDKPAPDNVSVPLSSISITQSRVVNENPTSDLRQLSTGGLISKISSNEASQPGAQQQAKQDMKVLNLCKANKQEQNPYKLNLPPKGQSKNLAHRETSGDQVIKALDEFDSM